MQTSITSIKILKNPLTITLSLIFLAGTDEEFQKLDEYYSSAEAAKGSRWAVEERMLSYQRQLEERGRTEINLEVSSVSTCIFHHRKK